MTYQSLYAIILFTGYNGDIMEILNTYTNKQGRTIPVRNIHFATLDDFENYKGTCIIENTRNNIFATTKNNPYVACISIPTYDEKKALKYYRGYRSFSINKPEDAALISKLSIIQPNIKLTTFPTGVVTIKDHLIGQEMFYLKDYITLEDLVCYQSKALKDINISMYYQKILNIIKELLTNGITYLDIHPNNFMINYNTHQVELIDYQSDYVKFNNHPDDLKQMCLNLTEMFTQINKYLSLPITFDKSMDLATIEKTIQSKKLILSKKEV